MASPDSCLLWNWGPEKLSQTMLLETLVFSHCSPQPCRPIPLLLDHILHSVANIPHIPFIPAPTLQDKDQGATSSFLPTFFSSPYFYHPSLPFHATIHFLVLLLHLGLIPQNPLHLFSYPVLPNPCPRLPSLRGSWSQWRWNSLSPCSLLPSGPFQIEKRLGSFSANPSLFIKSFIICPSPSL